MRVLAVGAGQRVAAAMLVGRGHEVEEAAGPEEALAAVGVRMPDLVLLPAEAGPAWCGRLRGLPGGEWCLVLLDTTGVDADGLGPFLAAGVDDFYLPQAGEAALGLRLSVAEAREARRLHALDTSRSEARLRDLLEAVPDGIACVTSDGLIVRVNRQLELLSGYPREELLGRPIEILVPPAVRGRHVGMRDGFFRNPGVRPLGTGLPLVLHRKDGTDLPVDICLGMHLEDGRPVATAAIRDVSERRRMEEEVRQARDRAEKAADVMRRDIAAAARVQRALLPSPDLEAGPFRFAWRYLPCAGLGGDALGIHPLGPGLIGLFLLDVSGHGAGAAMLSVALSLQLRPQTWGGDEGGAGWLGRPGEVAARLNRWLLSQPPNDGFVTMLYGVLDVGRRSLRYVSAGHPDLLLLPAGGGHRFERGLGMPLGVSPSAEYPEQEVRLAPGMRLLMFSDGVTEAAPGRAQLGSAGLARFTEAAGPVEGLCDRVVAEAKWWAGGSHTTTCRCWQWRPWRSSSFPASRWCGTLSSRHPPEGLHARHPRPALSLV